MISDNNWGDYGDSAIDSIVGGTGYDTIYMGFNDAWTSTGEQEYFTYI